MCLELGLHEDQGKHRVEGREAEVNKQLFWTCFKLGEHSSFQACPTLISRAGLPDQDLASLLGHDPSLKNSDVSYATSFVRSQGPLVAWPAVCEKVSYYPGLSIKSPASEDGLAVRIKCYQG